MSKIAIVYFSGYGHTTKQAEAVAEGIRQVPGAEAQTHLLDREGTIADTLWADLAAADAIIFGSPTYMGGPAWQFKKFADASSKAWGAQSWKNKIAAGFTTSASVNGDKYATILYMWTLAMQHSQIWVGTGLMAANKKSSGPEDANWTAGFGGALAISPADASPDEAPRSGDLETARHLGARVAELAQRLKK
jgi:NAD(P)H dehydrogenase (quinone)